MRITPQIVLETIKKHRNTSVFRVKESLPGLCSILDQSVLFTFPDVANTEMSDLCAFAADLYERDLFTLPFPVTALAFERDIGPPHGKRGGMMVLTYHQQSRHLTAISCSEGADRGTAFPIGGAFKLTLEKDGETGVKIYDNATLPIVSDEIIRAMFGRNGADAHEVFRHRIVNNALNAMGLVVMLMSKGVSTEHIAVPEKLNKARAKNGKPPIRDRYIVKIDIAKSRLIATEGGVEDISGHTRGSPRIHWRRGHFRTIHRGQDCERVVPVAPALIGANDEFGAPIPKSYKVTSLSGISPV